MIIEDPSRVSELNEGLPKVIYKYRHWEDPNHIRILTHNEIYFAPPSAFKSEMECRFFNDYEALSEEDIFNYCVAQIIKEGIVDKREIHEKALALYSKNKIRDVNHREEMERKSDLLLDKILSVFSVCERRDNKKLWESFSKDHTGYCVGINAKYIYQDENVFGSCGEVSYYERNNPPIIKPLSFYKDEATEKMMKVIYSLPDTFKEEEEFRFAKMHINSRVVKINPLALREVVLGASIDIDRKNEIIELVNSKYPNCEIVQASYDDVLEYFVFNKV